ncbi:DUF6471 domain-containing protein [Caballeronia sp. ATUFL_F2_KS42]|uniref:DUF6471 domain-containing protein n=1 Tax=Caballeronia sp. ATUFL_F2_KS42 TaxID=2921765 RepID=UPI00253FC700|nr:DUF6471 domain-containing protein [Caballeronia sp. ATUFL_F2_KS42]MDR5770116.1 DUF6471 domain-containing protein [Caballeronia sp. LZ028]
MASRVMRAALARKDVNYSALAALMRADGADETARSVEGKIQRGAMRCSFFLQALSVMKAEFPTQWSNAIGSAKTWDRRAAALLRTEMDRRAGVDFDELSRRLQVIGVSLPAEQLEGQIEEGSYALTLLLQSAAVLGIGGMERFIDHDDLLDAAQPVDGRA